MTVPPLRPSCPCGSGDAYDACCGRFHRGAGHAASAEELMRSRYAAFAVGDAAYLWRTWHPRTRPDDLELDATRTWTGLRVLGSGEDWVEFVASYDTPTGPGEQSERSRFEQRGGRWVYVDGDLADSADGPQ